MIIRDIVFVVNFFLHLSAKFLGHFTANGKPHRNPPLQHFVSEIPKFSKFTQKKGKE